MICIYKITSPTNKVYIGQTLNHVKRFSRYKVGDTTRQPKINASLKKHGFDAHEIEIIHQLPKDVEQKIIDGYEIFYMAMYVDAGYELMNLAEGGRGGKPSDETRQKMSRNRKGIPLEKRIGIEAANRQKERMSRDKKGVPHSPAHVENMKGHTCSDEKKQRISDGLKKYYASLKYNVCL